MAGRVGASGGRGNAAPVAPVIRKVLEAHLPKAALEVVQRLTRGWQDNPFDYDPELGRFEVAERWLWADVWAPEAAGPEAAGPEVADPDGAEEEPVDALLLACEVLTEHAGEILARHPGLARRDDQGAITLTYDFLATEAGRAGQDDIKVAERFLSMLAAQQAYDVQTEDLGSLRRVRVGFTFRSDQEYGSKKSHLDGLLELARRLRDGEPLQGRRT